MSYQAHPQMDATIGGGNRNSKDLPMVDGQREWSHGLFSCFEDSKTCCTACFCPCVSYSRVKNRYDHLATTGTADPSGGGELFHTNCVLHCLETFVLGFGWVVQFLNRGQIRERYKIKGNGLTDCLAAACCGACELTQEMREIELEEQSMGRESDQK